MWMNLRLDICSIGKGVLYSVNRLTRVPSLDGLPVLRCAFAIDTCAPGELHFVWGILVDRSAGILLGSSRVAVRFGTTARCLLQYGGT